MGKNKKRIFRFYSAWNYQKETDDLNQRSQEGWQLVRGGLFSSTFRADASVRYIYQLDYEHKIDNFARYLESFREQGWEYINSTGNGWSFFRKVYDPSLPPEEYEIYTDTASLHEMQHRWTKLAAWMCIALLLMFALELYMNIREPRLPGLILTGVMLLELGILGNGYFIMKNPNKRKSSKSDTTIMGAFLLVLILGLTCSMALMFTRTNQRCIQESTLQTPMSAVLSQDTLWDEINIHYTDRYSIDLDIRSTNPITFTIVNEDRDIIYQHTGSSLEIKNELVKLRKGQYEVHLSDFAGGQLKVEYELD